jgi:hypothetical protein
MKSMSRFSEGSGQNIRSKPSEKVGAEFFSISTTAVFTDGTQTRMRFATTEKCLSITWKDLISRYTAPLKSVLFLGENHSRSDTECLTYVPREKVVRAKLSEDARLPHVPAGERLYISY